MGVTSCWAGFDLLFDILFGILVVTDRRIMASCSGLMTSPLLFPFGKLLLLGAIGTELMPPFPHHKFTPVPLFRLLMLFVGLPGTLGDKTSSTCSWAVLPLKKILANPRAARALFILGKVAAGVVRVDSSDLSAFFSFKGLNSGVGKIGGGVGNSFISSLSTDELSISAAIDSGDWRGFAPAPSASESSGLSSELTNCSGCDQNSQLNKVNKPNNTTVPQTIGRRNGRSLALMLRIETGSLLFCDMAISQLNRCFLK